MADSPWARWRSAPTTATLVADPAALSPRDHSRLRAWLGLSASAMQTLIDDRQTLPLAPPGDPTAVAAKAGALSAVGLPVSAEVHARPLAWITGLTLRLGGLGALLYAVANLILLGMGDLIGHMPDPLVAILVLIPGVIGYAMALGGLPLALIFFLLGSLRQRARLVALDAVAQKIAGLRGEALPGQAGRLQAHCRDLARRVVEAGLPETVEADLLAGLDACLAALPELARALTGVEQAMDGANSPELAAAHARLTGTLTEAAARVSMVEVGLAELTANTLEGQRAGSASALSAVKSTAAALAGLARELR
jgi:hypothetical protein